MSIEVRGATLCVPIPLDLLFVSLDLLDVPIVAEIRSPFEVILHTRDQVSRSRIRGILGRSERSPEQQDKHCYKCAFFKRSHKSPPRKSLLLLNHHMLLMGQPIVNESP